MLSCVLLFLYWWEIPLGFEFYVVTLSYSGCPFLCALGLRNKARTSWSAISRLQLRLLTVCWLYISMYLGHNCSVSCLIPRSKCGLRTRLLQKGWSSTNRIWPMRLATIVCNMRLTCNSSIFINMQCCHSLYQKVPILGSNLHSGCFHLPFQEWSVCRKVYQSLLSVDYTVGTEFYMYISSPCTSFAEDQLNVQMYYFHRRRPDYENYNKW